MSAPELTEEVNLVMERFARVTKDGGRKQPTVRKWSRERRSPFALQLERLLRTFASLPPPTWEADGEVTLNIRVVALGAAVAALSNPGNVTDDGGVMTLAGREFTSGAAVTGRAMSNAWASASESLHIIASIKSTEAVDALVQTVGPAARAVLEAAIAWRMGPSNAARGALAAACSTLATLFAQELVSGASSGGISLHLTGASAASRGARSQWAQAPTGFDMEVRVIVVCSVHCR